MRATDRYAAQNRRARFDYLIEDKLEAGLVLHGTEVKVLLQGGASIAEAYADEKGGELFLVNANIPEYKASAHFNHEPRRPRKLLLHRKEVNRLLGAIKREGVTIVPLAIYFNERGRAKVELGLAHGKKKADKRQAERDRDWQRSRARLMRSAGRSPLRPGCDRGWSASSQPHNRHASLKGGCCAQRHVRFGSGAAPRRRGSLVSAEIPMLITL